MPHHSCASSSYGARCLEGNCPIPMRVRIKKVVLDGCSCAGYSLVPQHINGRSDRSLRRIHDLGLNLGRGGGHRGSRSIGRGCRSIGASSKSDHRAEGKRRCTMHRGPQQNLPRVRATDGSCRCPCTQQCEGDQAPHPAPSLMALCEPCLSWFDHCEHGFEKEERAGCRNVWKGKGDDGHEEPKASHRCLA